MFIFLILGMMSWIYLACIWCLDYQLVLQSFMHWGHSCLNVIDHVIHVPLSSTSLSLSLFNLSFSLSLFLPCPSILPHTVHTTLLVGSVYLHCLIDTLHTAIDAKHYIVLLWSVPCCSSSSFIYLFLCNVYLSLTLLIFLYIPQIPVSLSVAIK